ncbi:YdeI/OmpD-associated family protein [Sorangium sp. So ce1099]|uniref:YdeI/OmpD-associated family protein n=1 Tax=Sorangium sp. So ce1099 TaxID=3133331 RepID=UPI003F5D8CE7
MAPIVPDKSRIKSFPDEAAFEAWLAANHAQETELWLRIYKKDSGVPTVTHAQAVDVALCWGWIDGTQKFLDEPSSCSGSRRARRGASGARSTAITSPA